MPALSSREGLVLVLCKPQILMTGFVISRLHELLVYETKCVLHTTNTHVLAVIVAVCEGFPDKETEARRRASIAELQS